MQMSVLLIWLLWLVAAGVVGADVVVTKNKLDEYSEIEYKSFLSPQLKHGHHRKDFQQ